jgi:hypothetical protein
VTPDQLLLAGGVALGGAFWISHHRQPKDMAIAHPPPIGARGPIYDLLHPMRETLRIGDAKTDFYEKHMALRAMSGGFKTTVQAQILRERIRAGRAVVVITGGDSDQLETEIETWGGYVIRPHTSPLKFNAFEGTSSFMAQGWAGLFPTSSEAKVYHSAFEIACIRYFEEHSYYSVRGLMDFILTYDPDNDTKGSVLLESGERMPKLDGKLWKGMREGYVGIRLQLMEMAFGDWIGDELSVLHCVKQGIPIMFVLDSADDPDLNRFACALVWQAVNYAVRQRGDFDVFVDELGRLPANLVGDQVRTWRRNKCHLVVGSHKDDDFTPILEDLIHIQLLGQMVASATDTRKGASEKTWGTVHPTNFGPHVLGQDWTVVHSWLGRKRQGKFWMSDPERVQLVTVDAYSSLRQQRPRWSINHLNATAKRMPPGPQGGGGAAIEKGGGELHRQAPARIQVSPEPALPPSVPVVAPVPETASVAEGQTVEDEAPRDKEPVQLSDRRAQAPMPQLHVVATNEDPLPAWATEPWLAAIWRQSHSTGIKAILWRPGGPVWFDDEGCREWDGGFFKPKNGAPWRPRIVVRGHGGDDGKGGDLNPYREVVRAQGKDPDPTCDHWCDNPACIKDSHVEGGVDFNENTNRNAPRRALFERGGWTQVVVRHYPRCPKDCAFEHVRWREASAAEGTVSV